MPSRPCPSPTTTGSSTPSELDALLGPIALYPDPLLTQIFVAATVPLDIMKADRWVAENTELPTAERAQAAEAQGWDESVAVLAAGFPSVLQRLAADIDNTETLGNAVLAQTDDVLDAVQRLRAQAAATGYLESNDAQTVSTDEEGEIAIAPADPEVVYVPAYDAQAAYTTPPTAPTYVTQEPVYAQPGYTTGNLLTTGAIAFGSALLVNEIWDDDDDDWDDYWGPGSIDWDDDEFYHRPDRDIDIEGDVNIDRDRVVIDRDRTDIDREALRQRAADRPGSIDPDRVRDGTWKPDPQQRADARAKLDQRRARGADGAGRPAAGDRGDVAARLGDGGGALAAGAAGAAVGAGAARAKLQKSAAGRDVTPQRKPSFDSGLNPKRQGAPQVHRAKQRGELSAGKARAPQGISKPKPKSVSKVSRSRPPVSKSSREEFGLQGVPRGRLEGAGRIAPRPFQRRPARWRWRRRTQTLGRRAGMNAHLRGPEAALGAGDCGGCRRSGGRPLPTPRSTRRPRRRPRR